MPEVCKVQMMKNIALSKEILGKEIILWNRLRRLTKGKKEIMNRGPSLSYLFQNKKQFVNKVCIKSL